MWHKYEDKKPKNGQRIHVIGYWFGEIGGYTDILEEAIGYYDEEDKAVLISGDCYYCGVRAIQYWKEGCPLPTGIEAVVEDDGYQGLKITPEEPSGLLCGYYVEQDKEPMSSKYKGEGNYANH